MVFITPRISSKHTSTSLATSGNLSKSSTQKMQRLNVITERKVESVLLHNKPSITSLIVKLNIQENVINSSERKEKIKT